MQPYVLAKKHTHTHTNIVVASWCTPRRSCSCCCNGPPTNCKRKRLYELTNALSLCTPNGAGFVRRRMRLPHVQTHTHTHLAVALGDSGARSLLLECVAVLRRRSPLRRDLAGPYQHTHTHTLVGKQYRCSPWGVCTCVCVWRLCGVVGCSCTFFPQLLRAAKISQPASQRELPCRSPSVRGQRGEGEVGRKDCSCRVFYWFLFFFYYYYYCNHCCANKKKQHNKTHFFLSCCCALTQALGG